MTDTSENITITIPVKQAAQQHIEHLQATLTRRNEEIERLTERVREAESGEPHQRVIDAAYKRGWQDAANHLICATADAAHALSKVRKEAFAIYNNSGKA